MNSAVEFHDSKVTSINVSGTMVVVMLDGYVHLSDGAPGIDAGTGWLQKLRVELRGVWNVKSPVDPFTISNGCIITETEESELASVPFSRTGNLKIVLDSGTTCFEACATEIIISAVGPARYVEVFPG